MSNIYEMFERVVASREPEAKVRVLIENPQEEHFAATHLVHRVEAGEISVLDARNLLLARPLGIHGKEHAESLIEALSEAVEEGWFD